MVNLAILYGEGKIFCKKILVFGKRMLLKMNKEKFDPRQIMLERNYEYHHAYNETPPVVGFHQHSFYEIFFFLSGDVDYIIEGKTYALRPGDILLTSCSDIHRPDIRPGKPYERIVIWLEENFFDHLKEFCGEDLSAGFRDAALKDYRLIRPDSATFSLLKQLCAKISQAKCSSAVGSGTLAGVYLTEFLVHICRAYYNPPGLIKNDITENKKINQLIAYINTNLASELTLDQLSSRFYTSKYHLSRQFRQFTGLSLYQYIVKKRLILAHNLLRAGHLATEACFASGFSDYSNFLKVFKREFGRTPKECLQK